MPFKSKSQQRYMFANMPEMAKRWTKETPNIKKLPNKVKKSKKQMPIKRQKWTDGVK